MTSCRPLCHVDIVHDYFLSRGEVVLEAHADADRNALTSAYAVRDFFEIEPDDATAATLAGHRIIFRPTSTGFLLAVQIDTEAPDMRPAIAPAPDFCLTFALRQRDRRFANYTELGATGAGFYRFGNDSGSVVAGTRFLSQPMAAFDTTRRYVSGEVYAEPSGTTFNLFAALRDTGPSATPGANDWQRVPGDTWSAARTYQNGAIVLFENRIYRALIDSPGTDLNDPAQWQIVTTLGNQYASGRDTITLAAGGVDVDLGTTTLARATARVIARGSNAVVLERTFESAAGPLGRIHLDLSRLASGTYRIDILDDALAPVPALASSIHLSPRARAEGWFGVIELRASTGELALFNADGSLRTPRYTLRFLNRATRWRYIFPSPQPVGSGADVTAETPGDGRVLVTSTPRALTRFGVGIRLQADNATTPAVSEEILLPTPEVNRIRRRNAQWFSEIRLPNLTLGQ
jgi:hypothetical protein